LSSFVSGSRKIFQQSRRDATRCDASFRRVKSSMAHPALRSKRVWLGLAIAAACLFFLFRETDWAALRTALLQADYRWIVIALPIFITGYLVRALRWHHLLAPVRRVPTRALLPYLVIGFMANNVLPGRAGEFIRPYLAGERLGISRSASFATVVLERIFDGLTMLAIFGIASAFLSTRVERVVMDPTFMIFGHSGAEFYHWIRLSILAATGIFAGLLLAAFAAIHFKERSLALATRLAKLLPGTLHTKVEDILHRFVSGLEVLRSWVDLVRVFALSLFAWMLEGTTYYLVAQGFHLTPSFGSILILMALVNLAIMVPSSPGGWGPFEVAGVGYLKFLRVPEPSAIAYVLVIHSIIIVPITAWGGYFMAREGLSLREIERKEEDAEATT
jgi:glycosyltransferase 2 family protein